MPLKHGQGARISSSGDIFGHALRYLSKPEQNYSQLEKELFAIVFRVKHFHHYMAGGKMSSPISKHCKIITKPLHKAPPRILCLLICIQPYNLKIHYRLGNSIPIADNLSILHLPDAKPKTTQRYRSIMKREITNATAQTQKKEKKKRDRRRKGRLFS